MKHRREVRLVLDHFHEVLHLQQNQPPWEPASVFCKVWKTENEDSKQLNTSYLCFCSHCVPLLVKVFADYRQPTWLSQASSVEPNAHMQPIQWSHTQHVSHIISLLTLGLFKENVKEATVIEVASVIN